MNIKESKGIFLQVICNFTKRGDLMKIRSLSLLILILTVFTLTSCDAKTSTIEGENLTIEKVRLGITNTPPSWLALIADEMNYFKKHALDVNVKSFKSGKRALNGLFLDKVDIATTSESPVVFNSMRRQDFSIFATIGSSSNDNIIVAARDSGVTSPRDLKGKRIATQSMSSSHFYMHLFFLQNNLSNKMVRRSFMKVEELPQALHSKKVDAISTREPFYSEAMVLLGENAIVFETPGLYLKSFELVGFNDYLTKNSSIQIKILKSLLDAEDYLKNNEAETIELLSKRLSLSKANIKKSLITLNLSVRLEQSLILNMEDQARWIITNKLEKNTQMPNFLNYISTKALRRIKPDAVSIISKN